MNATILNPGWTTDGLRGGKFPTILPEDEFLHPERMEHFGIATVEASAAGAVPVVIERGGQKEIVTHNKNGLLWSTKTQLLTETLNLIKNKGRIKQLRENAINNSRRFTVEKFLRQYEEIIF